MRLIGMLAVQMVFGCNGKVTDVPYANDADRTGNCPSTPPQAGSQCAVPGTNLPSNASITAHCSYGDDPRPWCRTRAACQSNGTWTVKSPDPGCDQPALPAACPSPPPSSSSVCTDIDLSCWYGDGTRCMCSGCQGGTPYPVCQTIDPPLWACAKPAAGCPALVPQAGASCDAPGASCSPDCNQLIQCEQGTWVWRQTSCPKCAAPTTPIATPAGERPISDLHAGDLVYSVSDRAIVVVPIVRTIRTPVRAHYVVSVELDSGAILEISAGHPTADGKTFGDLAAGVHLDEQHKVVSAHVVPYTYAATYDILPGSSTGTYFAAGALVGSTLAERP